MLTFEIYANGILWGEWDAETAEEAIQKAADDAGTDGNTDDMIAVQVMLPYHDVRIKRYEPDTGSQMPAYMEEKSGGEWVSIADHVAAIAAERDAVWNEALDAAIRLANTSVNEGGMARSMAFFANVAEWREHKSQVEAYASAIEAIKK